MAVVICPTCSMRYRVDDATLAKFTNCRCDKCNTSFPIQSMTTTDDQQSETTPPLSETQQDSTDIEPQQDALSDDLAHGMNSNPEPSTETASLDEFALAEKMLEQLEETEDIETIFKKEGEPVEVKGNNPLLLNNTKYVWLVTEGKVDIFSVQIEQGAAVGVRTHLLRLEPGHIFLGIDGEWYGKERGLIAVGTIGSAVLQLDFTRFQQVIQTSEFTAIGVSSLLDQWLTALLMNFKQALIPKDCKELPSSGEAQFEPEIVYKPENGVVWVRHLAGTSTFMGIQPFPSIGEDGCFPVYKKTWLRAEEQITLKFTDTNEFIKEDVFWTHLNHFHLFILDCITITTQRSEIEETERLKAKAKDEEISLKKAFLNLIAVIQPEREKVGVITADPLLSACQAIGKQLDINFVPHPDHKKGRNSLADIVRASRVRMRQTVLKETWWRQDNGHLLAYREEDKRPVALLQTSPTKYILFDPVEKKYTKVTAKIADSLHGQAYTFYKAFPDEEIALKHLMKMGLYGIKKDLVTVFIMGILATLLGMLTPYVTGILFDTVIPGADLNQLFTIGIVLTVAALGATAFEITKGIAMLRLEGNADSTLQAALWDRLLTLPTSFFRDYSAGDLAIRSMGINAIRQVLAGVTIQSVLTAMFSIGYLALLIYYDWFLALVAVGISLVTVLITLGLGYLFVRYERPLNEIEGKISGLVLQLITGISKLRITGTEDRAFAVWAKEFSKQRKCGLKSRRVQNILATITAMIPVFASMIFFYFILSAIQDPEAKGLSTGKLLAFLAAYGTFQGNLLQMSTSLLTTLSVVPYYKRLKPILVELPEVDATKAHPGELSGNIEVVQVHFRYQPTGPLILKNISIDIQSGEFIALVGGSGSGKSTLMRLLLGFETPESGTVYYDGQDLSKVDILEVRRQIGVVLQNSLIMPGSIYQNIVGAGAADLTLNDAWEAARMAGCDQDIRAMPMGMHTVLPPGGGTLSGGQRQRIIIARAIVRKPRILFFDEATSALDNKTQAIVSESIKQLRATRIVIAHRLSTIIHADKIYVMDQGRLVESGTYHKLMKQEGLFAELAKRQMA